MFPFCFSNCCDAESRQKARLAQLDFLKWVRDSLETRLAATNAAIASLERQVGQAPSAQDS
ncbi:hypothetical protein [Lyngbya confervoides]|uniref:Uncharacterized protein n=1 Tax=Lyngbya confervoides BDU141951 TaxID=1574623 RepID=A0ABD4T7U7_9CYAN|nr:hypothetical protein [Lyngbya confervoides]MCM1984515.1 hypothetical protein [Lyngbya confervoides BDU141951]